MREKSVKKGTGKEKRHKLRGREKWIRSVLHENHPCSDF